MPARWHLLCNCSQQIIFNRLKSKGFGCVIGIKRFTQGVDLIHSSGFAAKENQYVQNSNSYERAIDFERQSESKLHYDLSMIFSIPNLS